jgi:hypothetical protein
MASAASETRQGDDFVAAMAERSRRVLELAERRAVRVEVESLIAAAIGASGFSLRRQLRDLLVAKLVDYVLGRICSAPKGAPAPSEAQPTESAAPGPEGER